MEDLILNPFFELSNPMRLGIGIIAGFVLAMIFPVRKNWHSLFFKYLVPVLVLVILIVSGFLVILSKGGSSEHYGSFLGAVLGAWVPLGVGMSLGFRLGHLVKVKYESDEEINEDDEEREEEPDEAKEE
jgi:hypothetical protein